MAAHDIRSIDRHIKVYLGVFIALLILTGVTVAVSRIEMSFQQAVLVALLVAGLKGTLVAGFFMHLFSDLKEGKPVLKWLLIFTVLFFLVLLLIPMYWYLDTPGVPV